MENSQNSKVSPKGLLTVAALAIAFASVGSAKAADLTKWSTIADVPSTAHRVNNPTPSCYGNVTPDRMESAILQAGGAVTSVILSGNPLTGAAVGAAIAAVLPNDTSQNYANCSLACAVLPENAVVTKAEGFISLQRDAGYVPFPDGRWGAGNVFINQFFDPKAADQKVGNGQRLYCRQIRNWSVNSEVFAKYNITYH